MHKFIFIGSLAFGAHSFLPALSAQPLGASSALKVDTETRVPGAILKPGDYTVKVSDYLSDRCTVQIVSPATKKTVATFLAVPNPSLIKRGSGDFVYWGANKKGRAAIRGWFIPGDPTPREFVYFKKEALEIAKVSGATVPAIDPESEHKPTGAALRGPDLAILQMWLLATRRVGPGDRHFEVSAKKLTPESQRSTNLLRASTAAPATAKLPHTAANYVESLLTGSIFFMAGIYLWAASRKLASPRGCDS